MRRVRLSWLIVALVVIATAIAPPLRHQAWAPVASWRWYHGRRDPVAFVNRHYPRDPQMLLAAGVEGNDRGMLRHAIAAGAGPAAWAALSATYADKIRAPRVGAAGVDPANTVMVRETEQQLKAGWAKERATLGDQHEVLEALHGWERADPRNGMPLALETIVLYGLDRDAEALTCWREAGRKPLVTAHTEEVESAVARLCQRMGLPAMDAIVWAQAMYGLGLNAQLREAARLAQYEGRKTQLEGRAQDAIAIWNATADFGYHMQQSAGSIIDYLVGSHIGGIGIDPTWEWRPAPPSAKVSDAALPPPTKGQLWFGPQHAFFVAHAGPKRDAELRDRRALQYARLGVLRAFLDRGRTVLRDSSLIDDLGTLGLKLLAGAGALLLLFLLVSSGRRPQADAAAGSRAWVAVFLVVTALTAVSIWAQVAVAAEVSAAGREAFSDIASLLTWGEWLPGLVPLALALLAFLLTAVFTRRRTPAWFAAWRGNMRRALPPTIALLVLCYLGALIAAIGPRAEATRLLSQNEMAALRRFADASWDHPKIPADAWRAAYPPKTLATGATP